MSLAQWHLVSPTPDEIPTAGIVSSGERSHGRRVGFLSNRKPNASVIQKELGRLAEEAGLVDEARYYEKPSPGVGAAAELLDQIAADCDVVMVGTADCGSCTAWSCNDAAELEARGLTAIVLCSSAFTQLAKIQSEARGLPDMARLEVPHPIGGSTADVAVVKAKEAWPRMEEWLKLVTVPAASGPEGQMSENELLSQDDFVAIQEWFVERGLTDGLPIVPPTEEAVAAMVAESGEPGGLEIGRIPPLGANATVSKVAANAVMAGCRPEHFRTVLTAVRALLEPEFNLDTIQTTTHPAAPLIIVHGPEARRIGINGKTGALGPGFRANAAIGRAIRLVLMNLGDARPGVRDFSTLGTPSKFSFCMTENIDDSPWPEFHTTRGFPPETSAVTVVGVEGPQSVNDHESTTPARNLDLVASVMGHLGSNNWFASDTASDIVVMLAPEHALLASQAGWNRAAVQRYLYHRSMRPATDLAKGGQWELRTWSPWMNALVQDPSARIPIVESPDNIMVLVAGGPGRFSAVMTGMGNISRAVTLPIPTA